MNKIQQLLEDKKSGHLMAHMVAGYPTARESLRVAKVLAESGIDIIELQIPFSDPMADGPTIAVACEEAIKSGMTTARSLALLKKISVLGKPIAVMTYLNLIYRYGVAEFVRVITKLGASALIVPDCPFDSEEGQELLLACLKNDVYLIPIVSPGVPRKRLEQLAQNSRGFVYCTSRQGITGATGRFSKQLARSTRELHAIFQLPIAIGFGVRSRADVELLKSHADIVVVGSAFVTVIRQNKKYFYRRLRTLAHDLHSALI